MSATLQHQRKIAFVSNNAWSMYNFRKDVLLHFIKSGCLVYVITPHDEYSIKLSEIGCHIIDINFDNRAENPLADLKLYQTLKKKYRQIQADFIFHYVIKPNIYGSMAAASLGIKGIAVVTGLGYTFSKKGWLNSTVKQLYRFALRKCYAVWFLNNEDARAFINERIVDQKIVHVLPGEGIDTDFFAPAKKNTLNKPFVFLMSARMLKSKGHSNFAEASAILRAKGYRFECRLIGFFEKNHPDSISHDLLNEWQERELINYLGFADDVRLFLNEADCFILPTSYNEGLSRGLMEASSMELPVITTYQRGCKELVIDQATGFFCNVNDSFDLAEKMEKMLLATAEQRVAMGIAGRKLMIEKFHISKVIHEYDQIVNSLGVR